MTKNSYTVSSGRESIARKGTEEQVKKISRFREVLPQVLASVACNFVLMDLNSCLGYSTVLIAQLHHMPGPLSLDDTQASWLGSTAYICQPLGSLSSGVLVDLLGRKRFMLLLNIPFLLGWVLMCIAPSYSVLCNVIMGVTIGLAEAPMNSYIGEVCKPEVRGIMTACAGIFSHNLALYFEPVLIRLTDWRTAAGISVSLPIFTAIYVCLVPEAPIWLVSKGRNEDAEKALCFLRGWVDPSAVKQELTDIIRYHKETKLHLSNPVKRQESPMDETKLSNNLQESCFVNTSFVDDSGIEMNGYPVTLVDGSTCCVEMLNSIRDLLKAPTLRPLLLVIPFFFFVHFAGYKSIMPFMVHVFNEFQMPISDVWAEVVIGVSSFFGTIFMVFSVNAIGKRPLSLSCTAASAVAALLLGLYAVLEVMSHTPEDQRNVTWVPLLLFVILSFCSSILAQMPWMLLSEVFPFRTRGLSGGVSAAGYYVFLFLSYKMFMDIGPSFQIYDRFFFYGSISCVGIVFLYFMLPETEGKTLEEIEQYFTQGLSARSKVGRSKGSST